MFLKVMTVIFFAHKLLFCITPQNNQHIHLFFKCEKNVVKLWLADLVYGAADNYPSWRRTDGRCQPATSRMSVCLAGWHTGHLDSMSPRSESSHIFWRSNGCSSTEYKYSYLQRNHRGLLLPHLSNTHTHTHLHKHPE